MFQSVPLLILLEEQSVDKTTRCQQEQNGFCISHPIYNWESVQSVSLAPPPPQPAQRLGGLVQCLQRRPGPSGALIVLQAQLYFTESFTC